MALSRRYSPDQEADAAASQFCGQVPGDQLQLELAIEVERTGDEWSERAMCHDKTELFFARPGEREGRRNRREALARAYCACCPVQRVCLLAGRLGREHGMWGGENDEQRAAAGFGPRSPHRRAVAKAAREARGAGESSAHPGEIGRSTRKSSAPEREMTVDFIADRSRTERS